MSTFPDSGSVIFFSFASLVRLHKLHKFPRPYVRRAVTHVRSHVPRSVNSAVKDFTIAAKHVRVVSLWASSTTIHFKTAYLLAHGGAQVPVLAH